MGSLKRVSIWLACSDTGVMARRLVGRLLCGSALVGTDSGPGSDIVAVLLREVVGFEVVVGCRGLRARWDSCDALSW